MTNLGQFTVRRIPLHLCTMHGKFGVWAEDGTDRWHCDDCVDDATWYAERVLRIDREIHAHNHRPTAPVRTCPYCNPGYVA